MTRPSPYMILWHAICALAVMILLLSLPLTGVNILGAFVGMVAVTAIAQFVYRFSGACSRGGEVVLTLAATIMAIGVILNVYYFTTQSGGTADAPILVNDDANRIWNDALARLGRGGAMMPGAHSYPGVVIAGVIFCFGQSIMSVLIFQMSMVLFTLVLTGVIAARLGLERRTASLAMCCTAAVCYFLGSGMVLTKDAMVFFFIALSAFALTGRRVNVLSFVIAASIAMLVRPQYLILIGVGVLITAYCQPRGQRQWVLRLTGIAMLAVMFVIPILLNHMVDIGQRLSPDFDVPVAQQQYAYYALVGDYYHFPMWRRLLLIPVSIITQFLIPFPWNFMRDTIFGWSLIYSHIAYPWYAFGCVLMYYMIWGHRYGSSRLLIFTLWGVFCWLVPCYTDGGIVSRYALPAVPLLAPAVAMSLARCRTKRGFRIWAITFVVLLTGTLLVCHRLQHRAPQDANPLQTQQTHI